MLLSIINGVSRKLTNSKKLNKSRTNYYIVPNAIVDKFTQYTGDVKDGKQLANEFVNNKRVKSLFDECEESWRWLEKKLVYVGNKDK